MRRPQIATKILLTGSLVITCIGFGGYAAAGSISKTAIGDCSAKNLTERTGRSGAAAGTAYTNLFFTNHGATACSLAGIPRAQPVAGAKRTAVGPYASINPITSRGGLVILAARKGVANVLYAMATAENYPKAKCIPQYADGVVITFLKNTSVRLTAYFPMGKRLVCTKLQSTSIAGVAKGSSSGP